MRAVVMQDAKLRVEEIAEPVSGPGEVLVDVLACGICGSDLHCLAHAPEFNAATRVALGVELMDLTRPIVFGHEFVGRVAAYGPGTSQRYRSAAAWSRCPRCCASKPLCWVSAVLISPVRTPSEFVV